jgi:hypothetical protein
LKAHRATADRGDFVVLADVLQRPRLKRTVFGGWAARYKISSNLGRIVMDVITNQTMDGAALAGGAIVGALLETHFAKGALSLEESRAVLQAAMGSLGPVIRTPQGADALRIIGDLQRGKFSAPG